MVEFAGSLVKYPARASFAWYFGLIATGAMVLTWPVCHAADKPAISAMDAAFIARRDSWTPRSTATLCR